MISCAVSKLKIYHNKEYPFSMMLRSFIAVEVSLEIQQAIARSTANLQITLPKPLIRWVAPQNIHLTLQFLGDVSPANLERVASELRLEASCHHAFDIQVANIGAFPSPQRARVIWIGLEAPSGLPALQRGVEAVTSRLGYPVEQRKFSPHLTIGRVDQNAPADGMQRIFSSIQKTEIKILGRFHVDAIHLMKSDLFPSGPVYTPLYALPLNHQ
jgi:RNA 2',3'-cyclic 3'-phosphodiesterase